MKKLIKTTDTAYVAITFLEPGEYDRISEVEVFSRSSEKDSAPIVIKSIKKSREEKND